MVRDPRVGPCLGSSAGKAQPSASGQDLQMSAPGRASDSIHEICLKCLPSLILLYIYYHILWFQLG